MNDALPPLSSLGPSVANEPVSPEPATVAALELDPNATRPPTPEEGERTRQIASTTTFPDTAGYEILSELGRGGMGVVYKARQTALKRLVALKMILTKAHAGPDVLTRFRAEAEAVARLQHPNIVQIYEIGDHDGLPFFSMEFVEGGSLAHKLKGEPQQPRDAAKLVEILALAMHAAHQKQIIHRDLKPLNVLLTADGIPKVSDFGLAKQMDAEAGQTQSGAVFGSPSYMAPEQAAGQIRAIGPRTDVYALGAILYEMLTGRPPFRATTPIDTIMQVVEQEPVPPSQLQAKMPRDLETICLKCLQKDPSKRYATAESLAEDLRRFLDGEPIAAHPTGLMDRLARTLGQDRLREEFHVWGSLLMLFAAIVFGAHLFLDYLYRNRQPMIWIIATDCSQFTLMGLALWIVKSRRQRPVHIEEHKLWLLVVGYLMSCALVRSGPFGASVYAALGCACGALERSSKWVGDRCHRGAAADCYIRTAIPMWQTLRAKYPQDFTVTPAQARAWREEQIGQCLKEGNLDAAYFHRDCTA